MNDEPSPNFTGYTYIDGIGKVKVYVRDNGRLSTGYSRVNEALPLLIRCCGEGKNRRWYHGALKLRIHELDGVYPNQVVQHYRKIAMQKQAEFAANTAKPQETTAPKESAAQSGLFAAAA